MIMLALFLFDCFACFVWFVCGFCLLVVVGWVGGMINWCLDCLLDVYVTGCFVICALFSLMSCYVLYWFGVVSLRFARLFGEFVACLS